MRSACHALIASITLCLILTAFPRQAHPWSASAHAFIAGSCGGSEQTSLQNYNVRMGSLVPDFFWYLKDIGLLDPAYADPLHGFDELPSADPATPLYREAVNNLAPWNVGLSSFVEGIKVHVIADIAVHNIVDGYLEGPGMWVDFLQQKTGAVDRLAIHLALEFSIDALLVEKYGNQISHLLKTSRQGTFLQTVLVQLTGDLGFDVRAEFRKYIALLRVLEKLTAAYGPYLTGRTLTDEFIREVTDQRLFDSIRDLSADGLGGYIAAFEILRDYPLEVYETITGDVHWEGAITEVIQNCARGR